MRAELPIQTLLLTEVKHHPENPRHHSRKQIEEIAASISDHGYAAGSMTIQQSTGYLAKGNGVYDALIMLGYTEADFVVKDMTDAETRQFMIRDNRLSDMSTWMKPELDALLVELKEEGLSLEDMAFNQDTLDELLAEMEADNRVTEDDFDPDDVMEEDAVTQTGDLIHLGNHRLLCGDSTDVNCVEYLMDGEKADMVFTDPPYGMDLDTDYSKMPGTTSRYKKIIGDDNEFDLRPIFENMDCKIWYIFGADYLYKSIPLFDEGNIIVWAKRQSEEELAVFGSAFELVWTYPRQKKTIWFDRAINQSSERLGEHPTQKPVNLCARAIKHDDPKIVCDPFIGSGTTLIACDQLDRLCYGMEISEKYCDVIIKRYIAHVGTADEVWVERDGAKLMWDEVS